MSVARPFGKAWVQLPEVPEHVLELLKRAGQGDTEAGAVALDWCEENGFGRSVALVGSGCSPLSRVLLYRSA